MHASVCARKNMHACIHASCICAFMQTFIHAYVRHIHMCIHANMQTCIHAFMQTCLHTCINLQVCMRTCVHLYMQSCLHTCMMREMWCLVWWERERESERDATKEWFHWNHSFATHTRLFRSLKITSDFLFLTVALSSYKSDSLSTVRKPILSLPVSLSLSARQIL